MPEHYFGLGSSLAGIVNVETLISTPPTVLPAYGGAPMPLMGGVGRRSLNGRMRRDGYAIGAWGFPTLDDDFTDLNALMLALTGDLVTSGRARYVSTLDTSGHYSPFLCMVDAPYSGDTLGFTLNEHPIDTRVLLVGGILQYLTKNANYTVTTADRLIYVDTSGGSCTMSLPAVSGVNTFTIYSFVKTSASNNLVLDPNSTEQIDGGSTKTITALNARVDIYTNGAAWFSL